jgi:hypothetical protein
VCGAMRQLPPFPLLSPVQIEYEEIELKAAKVTKETQDMTIRHVRPSLPLLTSVQKNIVEGVVGVYEKSVRLEYGEDL